MAGEQKSMENLSTIEISSETIIAADARPPPVTPEEEQPVREKEAEELPVEKKVVSNNMDRKTDEADSKEATGSVNQTVSKPEEKNVPFAVKSKFKEKVSRDELPRTTSSVVGGVQGGADEGEDAKQSEAAKDRRVPVNIRRLSASKKKREIPIKVLEQKGSVPEKRKRLKANVKNAKGKVIMSETTTYILKRPKGNAGGSEEHPKSKQRKVQSSKSSGGVVEKKQEELKNEKGKKQKGKK